MMCCRQCCQRLTGAPQAVDGNTVLLAGAAEIELQLQPMKSSAPSQQWMMGPPVFEQPQRLSAPAQDDLHVRMTEKQSEVDVKHVDVAQEPQPQEDHPARKTRKKSEMEVRFAEDAQVEDVEQTKPPPQEECLARMSEKKNVIEESPSNIEQVEQSEPQQQEACSAQETEEKNEGDEKPTKVEQVEQSDPELKDQAIEQGKDRTASSSSILEKKIRTASNASEKKGRDLFEERRRKIAEAEAEQEALAAEKASSSNESVEEAFVERVTDQRWHMHGAYEDKVLHAGLRQLDQEWNATAEKLLDLPRRKNGSPLLLREGVFKDLLSGTVYLKSLSANDVSPAQGDLHHLSLEQLLRLKVYNLTFSTGGAHGESHSAFVSRLDFQLYLHLGSRVTSGIEPSLEEAMLQQLGRDLPLLVALGLPQQTGMFTISPWISWHLASRERIFFDGVRIRCQRGFPEGSEGVFDVKENSSRDPAGRVWMQWQMNLFKSESELGEPMTSAESTGKPEISAASLGAALKGLKKRGTDDSSL